MFADKRRDQVIARIADEVARGRQVYGVCPLIEESDSAEGAVTSVCVLLYQGPLSPIDKCRLRTMAETKAGFEVARRDLEIRGPGGFMGARQSGGALLRFAALADDAPPLQQARALAPVLLAPVLLAPVLLAQHGAAARAHVARWLDTRADLLKA